jgi:hypothetical protein
VTSSIAIPRKYVPSFKHFSAICSDGQRIEGVSAILQQLPVCNQVCHKKLSLQWVAATGDTLSRTATALRASNSAAMTVLASWKGIRN